MNMRILVFGSVAVLAGLAVACSDPEAEKLRAFENGNQYFEQKRYPEAIVEYRNAVRADPRFGEARQKLADAYGFSGNGSAAFAEQIRAADLLPDDLDAQIKASAYLLLARQFEDAKTRVQRVLARDPGTRKVFSFLAMRWRDCAISMGPSRRSSRPSPSIRRMLAATPVWPGSSLRMASGKQARAAYEKAVEVDPNSVPARLALATFQWGIGDPSGAEETFKAALALDPKNIPSPTARWRATTWERVARRMQRYISARLRILVVIRRSWHSPTTTWPRSPCRCEARARSAGSQRAGRLVQRGAAPRADHVSRSARLMRTPLSTGCSHVSRGTPRLS